MHFRKKRPVQKSGVLIQDYQDFVKQDLKIRVNFALYDYKVGLHVKMSENYFQILEVGKNVGKFLFRRSVKMSENDLAEVQKCRKMDQKNF